MRCGHCGSSCEEPLPDELTTEEALNICDQIAELGLRWVTLSGGEPLTRKDINMIVKQLHDKGVMVNMITNGWLLTEDMVVKLKESGISTVAISIDGTEKIHDKIRKPKAFDHARKAFQLLKQYGIRTGAVTTLSKQNIDSLNELKEDLIEMGVNSWQVQLGLPMGNLKKNLDWVLEPSQVNSIIDFCYETAKEGRIIVYPADCIGYYTEKEMEIKRLSYQTNNVAPWDGCNAGIRGFGILQNGDILGCTSIRSDEFIEGNLRERSLKEIWTDENAFRWNRDMKKEKLMGYCKACRYGNKCKGGCPNTRLTMKGSIYEENEYCAYNQYLGKRNGYYYHKTDAEELMQMASLYIQKGNYQEAALAYQRVTMLAPDNKEAFKALGYCEYMCGNYEVCIDVNSKALLLDEADAEALRGRALGKYKMGKYKESLSELEKAAAMTGYQNADILHDLMVVKNSK